MIDWEAVHRRLAGLETALERGGRHTAAGMREVLRERARTLARPTASRAEAEDHVEFLEFTVANERYGVESSHIREVAILTTLTPVPGTPDFIGGIATVRGQILSVLDIGRLFDLPDPGGPAPDRLVILEAPDLPLALLVSRIVGVRRVRETEIETAVPTLTGRGAHYLRGIDRTGVAIFDAAALLAAQDIIVGAETGQ